MYRIGVYRTRLAGQMWPPEALLLMHKNSWQKHEKEFDWIRPKGLSTPASYFPVTNQMAPGNQVTGHEVQDLSLMLPLLQLAWKCPNCLWTCRFPALMGLCSRNLSNPFKAPKLMAIIKSCVKNSFFVSVAKPFADPFHWLTLSSRTAKTIHNISIAAAA